LQRGVINKMSNKKKVNGKKNWKEPEDKTKWLLDLIDASEAAVKGYEKYLLNKINYNELARIMVNLRALLPMDLDDKIDDQ